MKKLILLGLLIQACQPMRGITPPANPSDVESPDAIVNALYDVISGPAGAPRDWNRLRSLFIPDARLVPIGLKKEGGWGPFLLSVDDYIQRAGSHFERESFFEKEIARKTDAFAHYTHVWSTYASYRDSTGVPFSRGINSIQLVNDGKRWWVVTILWEAESKEHPIPPEYLMEKKP